MEYEWFDRAQSGARVFKDLLGDLKCAVDADVFDQNLPGIPREVNELRWTLNDAELARYRIGGRIAANALESACRSLKVGMTEHDIAALIDYEVRRRGAKAVVNLVAVDHRISQFRHPIPTDTKLSRIAMLVVCSEKFGLISNVTRFAHVGNLSVELRNKVQLVADVDTAVNFATRPGRTLGEIFIDLQNAYERVGEKDQWKFHHQGGSTGYAGREEFANPTSAVRVLDRQAFAWNPSVVGFKSEDTVFINIHAGNGGGVEVLTPHSSDWPSVVGVSNGKSLTRAGILEI